MISLAVQLRDTATPALKTALASLTNRQPLLAALGRGLEADLKAHFTAKNQIPNKRGWPKQGFWARIRNATAFTGATNDQATVSIADPAINAHYHGATIYPKDAKFLAIPARPEAYGVRPSSGLIPGLRFAVLPRGGPVLIQADHTAVKFVKDRRKGRAGQFRAKAGAEAGGGVFYWLRRSVIVPKDPTALPPTAQLQARLSDRLAAWLQRNVLGGNQ